MRILILFFFSLLIVRAGENHIQHFSRSIAREFGFDMQRFNDVSRKSFFATPSLAKQWGIINNSAEATYNDKINTLELKLELTVKDEKGKRRICNMDELRQQNASGTVASVSTIFHEMAHAEMDIFIEEGGDEADRKLFKILNEEVKPWLKKHFSTSSTIAFWELHGYYVGNILETMIFDIGDLETPNGVNGYNDKIFKSILARKKVKELNQADFSKFLAPEGDAALDQPYRDRLKVTMVWVKGKEVDLASIKTDPFKQSWNQALWDHFAFHFKPPASKRDLLTQLNKTHRLLPALKTFRDKMWLEANGSAAQSSGTSSSLPGFEGIQKP